MILLTLYRVLLFCFMF